MTGGKRLRIAALFVIVLVFAFIMDMSSNAITDNTLIRNDTGDGDTVYDLVLNADGFDEDYSYQLKVREEQPSDNRRMSCLHRRKKR
jgi:tight adherence protein C